MAGLRDLVIEEETTTPRGDLRSLVVEEDAPVKKKSPSESPAISLSASTTVSGPSKENGLKGSLLDEANASAAVKSDEGLTDGQIVGKPSTRNERLVNLSERANERNQVIGQLINDHNTTTSNERNPKVKELQDLHAQLDRLHSGVNEVFSLTEPQIMQRINELSNEAVEPVTVGQDQFGNKIEKKAPYKTVGEMLDATKQANTKYDANLKKLRELDVKINPEIQQFRNERGFKMDAKDAQGNEYYKMNPIGSFINGFGNSVDAISIGLKNIAGDEQGAAEEMKKKWVMDNVLYPKQSDGKVGELAEMAGGVAPLAVGGALTGGGGLGAVAANALLFGMQDYGGKLYESFGAAKANNPEITDEEAMEMAKGDARFAGVKGMVIGATLPAQGALGRKIFLNNAERGAFKTFLAEQGVMAPAFGASTAIQNWYEDKPVEDGVGKSMVDAFIIGGMMHSLGALPRMPANLKATFENGVAKNYGKLSVVINDAVNDGVIDYATANNIAERARAFDVVGKNNPPEVENKLVDNGIELNGITKEIEQRKEVNPLADTKDLEVRAEQVNREIAETKGTALTEKEQKEYDKLIEKKDTPAPEGGKKPELLQSEKDKLEHFEKRIASSEKNIETETKESLKPIEDEERKAETGKETEGQLLEKPVTEVPAEQQATDVIEQNPTNETNTEETIATPDGSVENSGVEQATTEAQPEITTPVEEPPLTADVTNPNEVKKTLLTERAYEGNIREEVKQKLEEKGLTRQIESQEEVAKKAKELIDEVGAVSAVEAVRKGDIKGANASAVLAMRIADIDSDLAVEQDVSKITALQQEQADLINDLGELNLESGRLNSMMNYVYQNFNIGYNVEKKIGQYKEANGGTISPEVEAKFREIDANIKDLNKRIAEAEAKQADIEAKGAVENIKEVVAREKKNKNISVKRGKDLIAEGLDDLVTALGGKKMAVGDRSPSVSMALEKIGKGLIDEGTATIENVAKKVKEYVEDKFSGKLNFDDYADGFEDAVSQLLKQEKTTGKVKVAKSLINRWVGEGVTDINDLVAKVKTEIAEEYPDASDRDIRDAITGYGKVSNLSQDEISTQIRKLTRAGRIVSGLEDIAQKKRPLRSGAQRDKLDADERAQQKQLREAMKDLPIDAELEEQQLKTQLDATKQRVQNQIDDLEREIVMGEQVPKDARTVTADAELTALKEKRDKLKEEHDRIFKDDTYKEARRLELTKKATERRIGELKKKLKEGDFTKKPRKPLIADNELIRLKAEKLREQEKYDKEVYKAQLENRSKIEKWKDAAWEAWGLTRLLSATADFSFIGVQGLTQTLSHPIEAAKALKNSLQFTFSEKKTEQWLSKIKAQDFYPVMKEAGLALTEPKAKITAREESFYSGWTNMIWDALGTPAKLKSPEAYDKWKAANPFKAFERGAVGYLDTLRVARFLDGMNKLNMEGKNIYENKQDYKDVADAINTMTGRSSLKFGGLNLEQNAEMLSKVFFSPRNWASQLKTTLFAPAYLASLSPTARKMAAGDLIKQIGITTGMMAMATAYLNSDDDPETSVELDPRSSDFMKIKLGKKRVDPWGGKIQMAVLFSRLAAQSVKTGKGSVVPLGTPYKSKTMGGLIGQQAVNKLAPSMSVLYNLGASHKNEDGTRVDDYGHEYKVGKDIEERLIPIYYQTLADLYKDDPNALNGLLAFGAFMGAGVNVQEQKEKAAKSGKDKPDFGGRNSKQNNPFK